MTTDRLRVESNQRVDIEDFKFLAGEGTQASFRQLTHQFLSDGSTVGWILSGFAMSNPAGSQLQVTRGSAILSQRLDGAAVGGIITTEGEATRIVDLTSYSAGDYGIYIRFSEIEADPAGRLFWNPTGLGSEYVQNVPTRYQANWEMRVESGSPGSEWMKIGTVAQATMVITDERVFYFEGDLVNTYESGWSSDGGGVANDRNADRKTYGVSDLHTFVASMKQCVEDIKGRGLKRWWDRDIGGMNIGFDADPVAGQLAVGDANFHFELDGTVPIMSLDTGNDRLEYVRSTDTLSLVIGGGTKHTFTSTKHTTAEVEVTDKLTVATGAGEGVDSHLIPTGSAYDLGSSGYQWRDLWIDGTATIDILSLSTTASEGVGSDVLPTGDSTYDLGSASRRWEWIYGVRGNFESDTDQTYGLSGTGGDGISTPATIAGSGVVGHGGISIASTTEGGWGIEGVGGDGTAGNAYGGVGVYALGGDPSGTGAGGYGIWAMGGGADHTGEGGRFYGSTAVAASVESGATGVYGVGGDGDGASKYGGAGGLFYGGDNTDTDGYGGTGAYGGGGDGEGTGRSGYGMHGLGGDNADSTEEAGTGGWYEGGENGGHGLVADGGDSADGAVIGGSGVEGIGGSGTADNADGGIGVYGFGGLAHGTGVGGPGVLGLANPDGGDGVWCEGYGSTGGAPLYIVPQSAAPVAKKGVIYYDSDTDTFMCYDGGWKTFTVT